MFSTSKKEGSGLFKKAAGAYLTYKVLPFGSSKEETGSVKKLATGYLAMKTLPKIIKWIGGGALLALAASYGYSRYNQGRSITHTADDQLH